MFARISAYFCHINSISVLLDYRCSNQATSFPNPFQAGRPRSLLILPPDCSLEEHGLADWPPVPTWAGPVIDCHPQSMQGLCLTLPTGKAGKRPRQRLGYDQGCVQRWKPSQDLSPGFQTPSPMPFSTPLCRQPIPREKPRVWEWLWSRKPQLSCQVHFPIRTNPFNSPATSAAFLPPACLSRFHSETIGNLVSAGSGSGSGGRANSTLEMNNSWPTLLGLWTDNESPDGIAHHLHSDLQMDEDFIQDQKLSREKREPNTYFTLLHISVLLVMRKLPSHSWASILPSVTWKAGLNDLWLRTF